MFREQLGLAVLFVTHDLGVVAEICDSVMVMYGGTVAEVGEIDAIYNNAHHPYTQQLLAAFPTSTTHKRASPRSLARRHAEVLPPGCRFARAVRPF